MIDSACNTAPRTQENEGEMLGVSDIIPTKSCLFIMKMIPPSVFIQFYVSLAMGLIRHADGPMWYFHETAAC